MVQKFGIEPLVQIKEMKEERFYWITICYIALGMALIHKLMGSIII